MAVLTPKRTLVLRILGAATVVSGLITIITLMLWLAFKPRLPNFGLNSATVSSLSTSTGAELTARFNVLLVLSNPNLKLDVFYERLEISIWFDHRNIATASLEPFLQKSERETPVQAEFPVVRKLLEAGVVREISVARAHGSVDFGVSLLTTVKLKSGEVHSKAHVLKVDCFPVRIVFPSKHNINDTGTLAGPSHCKRFHL